MPRDFDEARRQRAAQDRSFILGGETFVVRMSLAPEELQAYEDLKPDTPLAETMQTIDDLVVAMIEEGEDAHARYRNIRTRRGDDAISIADLQALVEWMMEVFTGRPTVQPGGSSVGRGTTGTNLTEPSSSPGIRAA